MRRRLSWVKPPQLRPTLGALAFLVLFPCGHLNLGDSEARYAQTRALLFRGLVDIPREWAKPGSGSTIAGVVADREGRFHSKYPPGLSLVWIAPVAAATLTARLTGLPDDVLSRFAVGLVNPALLLATVFSIGTVLRRLGARPGEVRLTQAAYLLGTSALPYASTSFSEPLVGLGVLWAVMLLHEGRAALAGGALAGAVLVRSEVALAVPLLAAAGLLSFGRGRLSAFAAVAALGPAATVLLNVVLRGDPSSFGYQEEATRFLWPPPGLSGLFLSVDKNLLLFNPFLVVAAAGWLVPPAPLYRPLRLAVALLWLCYLPFYSSWHAWHGGWCFGPRFFVILLPVTILPVGGLLVRLHSGLRATPRALFTGAVAVALACSAVVQLGGVAVKPHQAIAIAHRTGGGQLATHLRLLALKLERGIAAPEVYRRSDFVALAPGETDERIDHRHVESFQYLNFWWSLLAANSVRGGFRVAPGERP